MSSYGQGRAGSGSPDGSRGSAAGASHVGAAAAMRRRPKTGPSSASSGNPLPPRTIASSTAGRLRGESASASVLSAKSAAGPNSWIAPGRGPGAPSRLPP